MSEKEGAIAANPHSLFTMPTGTNPKVVDRTFSGFSDEERRVGETMMRRRIIELESSMKEMQTRMEKLEKTVAMLTTEKGVWKNAYDDLHAKFAVYEKKSTEYEGKVKELNVKQEAWKKEQENKNIDFRKIVEEQTQVNDTKLTEKVVQVIKQKGNLVRDTVDRKKTVLIFCLKE